MKRDTQERILKFVKKLIGYTEPTNQIILKDERQIIRLQIEKKIGLQVNGVENLWQIYGDFMAEDFTEALVAGRLFSIKYQSSGSEETSFLKGELIVVKPTLKEP